MGSLNSGVGLSPAARADNSRMCIVGALPDLHASESRVARVCAIMLRQWQAVTTWLMLTYGGNTEALPHHGGWDELPKFRPGHETA